MKEKFSKINSTESGSVVVVCLTGHYKPYVFGSLAAIFSKLSPEQVGCTLKFLYENSIKKNDHVTTSKGMIFKLPILRVSQKK